jgi:haloalkane dehalogenase
VLSANQTLDMPKEQDAPVSGTFGYVKKRAASLDLTMAYVDEGSGDSIVFLHGDMMSSYLWREVIPHTDGLGRRVAVDLIGAGDSDKLRGSGPGSYCFADHARYLEGLLETLDLGDDIIFMGHDWGANLAFDWSMRHPGRVKGIAFSEAVLPPFEWTNWPNELRDKFAFLRSEEGERAVLDDNYFVTGTQFGVLRTLSATEKAEYTRPYAQPGEMRRPTLTWPREVPFDDDDTPTRAAIEAQAAYLASSDLPKLHILGKPGAMAYGERLDRIRSWPRLSEVTVDGYHWPPEDDPHALGRELAAWIGRIRQ